MPLTLTHAPRVARRMQPTVLTEVGMALLFTAHKYVEWFQAKVSLWDDKPTILYDVDVKPNLWRVVIWLDMSKTGSKKFVWSDVGTGKRGPHKQEYIIRPVNAKALKFSVPYLAKTPPTGPTNKLPAGTYLADYIVHPGIWPRDWTKEFNLAVQDRKRTTTADPPGFNSTIEAAIKRAFRKEGIYK